LPGIGPYTAGAVGALAFGERAPAVDGNVERVFSRLLALEMPWDKAKVRIRDEVSALVPEDRPAEFAEGLMDLGATICTPKRPNCLICPVSTFCKARKASQAERYPIKAKKKKVPHRTGHVFLLLGWSAARIRACLAACWACRVQTGARKTQARCAGRLQKPIGRHAGRCVMSLPISHSSLPFGKAG